MSQNLSSAAVVHVICALRVNKCKTCNINDQSKKEGKDQGPISSTGLRRVFVLKTSYEVRTLKIGFHHVHQTIELCELLTFCRIFKSNNIYVTLHFELSNISLLGPISSTGLRRVFVLKTSYEVRTLKIGFH